jgi:serine/threonine-protein kinase
MLLAVVPFAGVGDDPPSPACVDGLVETLTSTLSQMERFQSTLSVVPASDVRRTDAARELLQAVVAQEPEGYDNWNRLGALYYQLGDLDLARQTWERSLTFGPSYAAYSNLGSVEFAQGRLGEAASMYEQALAIQEDDYQLWINLAAVYERLPEQKARVNITYRKAIALAEREHAANPRNAAIAIHLAECYATVGDTTGALALTSQALGLLPDDVQVVVRAGLVYEQVGRRDPAVEMIGKALDLGFPLAYLEAQPQLEDLLKDPRLAANPSHR